MVFSTFPIVGSKPQTNLSDTLKVIKDLLKAVGVVFFVPHSPCMPQYNNEDMNKKDMWLNFMVTPCINSIQHFNFQLMHTTLKNAELLKHFKISKTAPTCFGLQENHHHGAIVNT